MQSNFIEVKSIFAIDGEFLQANTIIDINEISSMRYTAEELAADNKEKYEKGDATAKDPDMLMAEISMKNGMKITIRNDAALRLKDIIAVYNFDNVIVNIDTQYP